VHRRTPSAHGETQVNVFDVRLPLISRRLEARVPRGVHLPGHREQRADLLHRVALMDVIQVARAGDGGKALTVLEQPCG